jgi:uncharacterized membrane protein
MQYCNRCGKAIEDGAAVCPACGNSLAGIHKATENAENSAAKDWRQNSSDMLHQIGNTRDQTQEYSADDVEKNKVSAFLSYLGPLILVPLLASQESKYAKFHANQGLTLFVAEICSGIIGSILYTVLGVISWRLLAIASLWNLTGVLFLFLTLFGIINALQGRAKELPLFGRIRILR